MKPSRRRRKNLLPAILCRTRPSRRGILGVASILAATALLARYALHRRSAPHYTIPLAHAFLKNDPCAEYSKQAAGALTALHKEPRTAKTEALQSVMRFAQCCRDSQEWPRLDALASSLWTAPRACQSDWLLGRVLELDEDYTSAQEALNRARFSCRNAPALLSNPELVDLYSDLGRLALDQGQYREAVDFFRKAIKIDPRAYFLYIQLAQACRMRGDYRCALKADARAKTINPKETDAYIQEGYAKFARGDVKGARKDFQQVASLNAPLGQHHIATLYAESGDLTQSIHYYEVALRRFINSQPSDFRTASDITHTFRNLADSYRKIGKKDLAEKAYRKALGTAPEGSDDWFRALRHLSEFYDSSTDFEKALTLYRMGEAFCKRNHGHPRDSCFGIYTRHALTALHQGRKARAEALYQTALSEHPPTFGTDVNTFSYSTILLGDAAAALGHENTANYLYKSVISLRRAAPADHIIRNIVYYASMRLADLYAKEGHKSAAAQARREARRLRARIAPKS